jgi:hypothetical protein
MIGVKLCLTVCCAFGANSLQPFISLPDLSCDAKITYYAHKLIAGAVAEMIAGWSRMLFGIAP